MMRSGTRLAPDWGKFVADHSFALILVSSLGIVAVTLYPFQFQAPVERDGTLRIIRGVVVGNPFELLANIFLFIPLGLSFSAFITQAEKGSLLGLALVFLVGVGFSFGIEWLQRFLPSRSPTFTDVVTNGSGMLVGIIAYVAWLDGRRNEQRTWGWMHKGFGLIRYRLGRRHVYITRLTFLRRYETDVFLENVVRGALVRRKSGRTRIALHMQNGIRVIIRVRRPEVWWRALRPHLPVAKRTS